MRIAIGIMVVLKAVVATLSAYRAFQVAKRFPSTPWQRKVIGSVILAGSQMFVILSLWTVGRSTVYGTLYQMGELVGFCFIYSFLTMLSHDYDNFRRKVRT